MRISSRSKSEHEYQKIKALLIDDGVTQLDEVQTRISAVINNGKFASILGLVVTLASTFFFKDYTVLIICIYVLYLGWVWSSIHSGKQLLERYIKECIN